MIQKRLIPFYILILVIFLILKYLGMSINLDHVTVLLYPVNKCLQILTGGSSVYIAGEGYYFEKIQIVLDKSCSGFNLWLLCFLILSFLFLKYSNKLWQRIVVIPASLGVAYVLAIVINTCRIYTSIILQRTISSVLSLHPDMVHEAIGIINNVFFLTLIYYIAEKILQNRYNHAKLT